MTTKEFAKILQDKLTSEYGVDLPLRLGLLFAQGGKMCIRDRDDLQRAVGSGIFQSAALPGLEAVSYTHLPDAAVRAAAHLFAAGQRGRFQIPGHQHHRLQVYGHGARGDIVDSRGERIATSVTSYNVVLNKLLMGDEDLDGMLQKICLLYTSRCV